MPLLVSSQSCKSYQRIIAKIMATKPQMIEEAKKLGIELTGKETVKDLTGLIAKAKGVTVSGKVQLSGNNVILWLKNRAYVDDKQRVNAGVYLIDRNDVPDRLARLKSSDCEVLTTDVNSRKVAQIARWSGINPDGLDDEEILSRVLSTDFQPFA